jgi:hypothetical protein
MEAAFVRKFEEGDAGLINITVVRSLGTDMHEGQAIDKSYILLRQKPGQQ